MPKHLFGYHVLETKQDVYFPVNPERVEIATGPHWMSYTILEIGEVQIPRGRKLKRVKWEGWVPGPDYCYGTRSRPDFLNVGGGVLSDPAEPSPTAERRLTDRHRARYGYEPLYGST